MLRYVTVMMALCLLGGCTTGSEYEDGSYVETTYFMGIPIDSKRTTEREDMNEVWSGRRIDARGGSWEE